MVLPGTRTRCFRSLCFRAMVLCSAYHQPASRLRAFAHCAQLAFMTVMTPAQAFAPLSPRLHLTMASIFAHVHRFRCDVNSGFWAQAEHLHCLCWGGPTLLRSMRRPLPNANVNPVVFWGTDCPLTLTSRWRLAPPSEIASQRTPRDARLTAVIPRVFPLTSKSFSNCSVC